MNTKARNENGITHELAIALEWLTTTEKDLSNGRKVFSFTNMFDVIRREWEEQGKLRANHRKIDFALSKSHAVEYLKAGKFPLTMAHFTQPKAKADTRDEKPYDETSIYEADSGLVTVYGRNIGDAWTPICRTTSKCNAIDTAMDWGMTFVTAYGQEF